MDLQKTGALIARARRERGLTQREVGEALHVTLQAVSKWERGLSFPDAALLEPLAGLLGLTVSELLAGERGEAPREELVRDGLRLLLAQMGGQVRRWRGLFAAAAALLVLVLLGLGYVWVRDNTDWLPQRETVVSGLSYDRLTDLAFRASGGTRLYYVDVILADGCSSCTLQLELWGDTQLVETWELAEYGPEDLGPGRRRTMAVSCSGTPNHYRFGVSGLGYTVGPMSADIPFFYTQGGWEAAALEEKTAADRDHGAVLLCFSLLPGYDEPLGDGQSPLYPPGQVGNFEAPAVGKGEGFLLLRLLCA